VLSDIATISMISVAFLSDACTGLHSLPPVSQPSYDDRCERGLLIEKGHLCLNILYLVD
jgi:hypothetical protein